MSQAGGAPHQHVDWVTLRTVCHDCRTLREVIEQTGPHEFQTHAMVVPGDGMVYHRVGVVLDAVDAVVEMPCPACGDSETPGWLTGFAMPA